MAYSIVQWVEHSGHAHDGLKAVRLVLDDSWRVWMAWECNDGFADRMCAGPVYRGATRREVPESMADEFVTLWDEWRAWVEEFPRVLPFDAALSDHRTRRALVARREGVGA